MAKMRCTVCNYVYDEEKEGTKFEERAMNILTRLGLGQWGVCWLPDSSIPIRGKVIPEKFLIEIYDSDEEDA